MPKAFVSHATIDQDRFVRGLAERLQTNGVETWYAEWALLDGDSLTERIFEQGIGEADIFIVVLSQHSVDSNWVKAELAVGLVRQIEKKCRLIPIVLDEVEAPVALQGTLQRRIADPASYDSEFDALLRSMFNKATTPPLGKPASYTSAPSIRGMTPADALCTQRSSTWRSSATASSWMATSSTSAAPLRACPMQVSSRPFTSSIGAVSSRTPTPTAAVCSTCSSGRGGSASA